MTVYGFETDDRDEATAALLVYAVWRSRDTRRFKITPDVWSQVERFVKASAKRSTTIPRFLETLKPRLMCGTLHPRAMAVGLAGVPTFNLAGGGYVELASEQPEQREFLTAALALASPAHVLSALYRETAWVVLLVRDRLERERPIEARIAAVIADDDTDTSEGE